MISMGLSVSVLSTNSRVKHHSEITLLPIGGKRKLMNNISPPPQCTSTKGTGNHRPSPQWLRLPLLLLMVAVAVVALAATALADSPTTGDASASESGVIAVPTPPPLVIYLGFKSSDEIEFDDDDKPDFKYKNEDIVAFVPATGDFYIFFDGSAFGLSNANLDDFEVLSDGSILFTLRSKFSIPGLGQVDDSDIVKYTPGGVPNPFTFYLKGSAVGLTKGAEDIDALGFAADGKLIISTIGTAKVPGISDDVKDQDLIKLEPTLPTPSWSLYFDGSDVALTNSSEDIRSVWVDAVGDAQGNKNVYLTLSGDFKVKSDNEDKGDKNDVEGCYAEPLSTTPTKCFFFKLLDGETVGAENQLDGLSVVFSYTPAPISAAAAPDNGASAEIAEGAADIEDFTEAVAENDSEITEDDFIEFLQQLYLPFVQN
jgi:hypothetical protein